jgi:hypothetical protein
MVLPSTLVETPPVPIDLDPRVPRPTDAVVARE